MGGCCPWNASLLWSCAGTSGRERRVSYCEHAVNQIRNPRAGAAFKAEKRLSFSLTLAGFLLLVLVPVIVHHLLDFILEFLEEGHLDLDFTPTGLAEKDEDLNNEWRVARRSGQVKSGNLKPRKFSTREREKERPFCTENLHHLSLPYPTCHCCLSRTPANSSCKTFFRPSLAR